MNTSGYNVAVKYSNGFHLMLVWQNLDILYYSFWIFENIPIIFGQNFGPKVFLLETIQLAQKWLLTKINFLSHVCQKNDQAFWLLIFLTNFWPKIFFLSKIISNANQTSSSICIFSLKFCPNNDRQILKCLKTMLKTVWFWSNQLQMDACHTFNNYKYTSSISFDLEPALSTIMSTKIVKIKMCIPKSIL